MGHPVTVELLLDRGADPEAVDKVRGIRLCFAVLSYLSFFNALVFLSLLAFLLSFQFIFLVFFFCIPQFGFVLMDGCCINAKLLSALLSPPLLYHLGLFLTHF